MNKVNDTSVCDPPVFNEIFQELGRHLYNFMYYKTANEQRSEDLVQEAFLKLWKNCAKVQIDKAKSYLFTIANNMFLDEVKHEKVKLKYQQFAPKQTTNESPEYLAEMEEFKVKLQNAIAQLPEKQRTVFLMNRIDKMKYKEIAEHLGISVKAVEKRMHNALKEIRKLSKNI